MSTRQSLGRAICLVLISTLLFVACGGSDDKDGVIDAAAGAESLDRPAWVPGDFDAPDGASLVEIIDDPAPGFGRSATWRSGSGYQSVLRHVDDELLELGWIVLEREDLTDDERADGATLFIDNEVVYAIRVFNDPDLDGTRITLEVPAE